MTFQVTNPVVNFNIWDATQTTNDDNTVSFTASYFMKNGANFAVCVTNSFGSTGPSAGLSGTGANTDVIPLAARIRAKMLGYLRENFPTVQTLACMAYTGFEHVKPVSAEDFARENTAIYGMDLAVTNAASTPNTSSLAQTLTNGSIVAGQTYNFLFWADQISSGVSYVQNYRLSWLNGSGATLGTVGWNGFSGGNGAWAQIVVTNLIAPANAVNARVEISGTTGAVLGGHGEVLIDDVALAINADGNALVAVP